MFMLPPLQKESRNILWINTRQEGIQEVTKKRGKSSCLTFKQWLCLSKGRRTTSAVTAWGHKWQHWEHKPHELRILHCYTNKYTQNVRWNVCCLWLTFLDSFMTQSMKEESGVSGRHGQSLGENVEGSQSWVEKTEPGQDKNTQSQNMTFYTYLAFPAATVK